MRNEPWTHSATPPAGWCSSACATAPVSQHLKVLRAAGLVVVRADGTRRLYGVNTRGIEALRSWLDGFWDKALVAFKAAADRAVAKERKPR